MMGAIDTIRSRFREYERDGTGVALGGTYVVARQSLNQSTAVSDNHRAQAGSLAGLQADSDANDLHMRWLRSDFECIPPVWDPSTLGADV